MKTTTTKLQIVFLLSIIFFSTIDLHADCRYKESIKGQELAVGVILSWTTSQEKDNAMFIIERSDDGIHFTNIGAVKGLGHSIKNKPYSFLDSSLPGGQCYYRLRQIDFNGVFTISSVFVFNKSAPALFHISNIASELLSSQLRVQFDSFHTGLFEYEIIDEQGKSLLISSITATKGINNLKVDLSDFENLIYHLTLRAVDQEQTISFQKK